MSQTLQLEYLQGVCKKVSNKMMLENIEKLQDLLKTFDVENNSHYIQLKMICEDMQRIKNQSDGVSSFLRTNLSFSTNNLFPPEVLKLNSFSNR